MSDRPGPRPYRAKFGWRDRCLRALPQLEGVQFKQLAGPAAAD